VPEELVPTPRLLPEIEEAVRRLPGVRAASVVVGELPDVTTVHVVAGAGTRPDDLARTVRQLASERFGLSLAPDDVSVVVQAPQHRAGADRGPADVANGGRAAVRALTLRSTGGRLTVSVELGVGPRTVTGTAVGAAGSGHRAHLVAVAVLEALRDLLPAPCGVESVQVVRAVARDVALTVLALGPGDGEGGEGVTTLTGSAPLRGDEADAVARSVLDALNRHLGR
jgi:hypothetical protein